jgi:drug/metabolite transporter (DMT)-like permease
MTPRRRGILLALAGMLAVSTDSLFARIARTDAFGVTFWVGALTAVVLLGGTAARSGDLAELVRRGGWPLGLAGGLQAVSTGCFVLAVKHTSVANVVVSVTATRLFAAAVAWLWGRERSPPRVWLAIGVCGAGIGLIVSGSVGGGALIGDLFALTAVASFATGIVLLRRVPSLRPALVVGLGGAGMALIAFWPAPLWGYPATTWLALIGMGAVFGPLARWMLATAPRYLPAAEVGLFAPLETVFASLWAYLAFGESPAPRTWAGAGIVLGGLLFGVWPRRDARPRARSAQQ